MTEAPLLLRFSLRKAVHPSALCMLCTCGLLVATGKIYSQLPDATPSSSSDSGAISAAEYVCSDPVASASDPQCSLPSARTRATNGDKMYVDSGGMITRRDAAWREAAPAQPRPELTDFQRLVATNTGELLPVFGSRFFRRPASTFAPLDRVPASGSYIIGPSDQLLVRISGAQPLNSQLTVDRTGAIYIPQIGSIQVAGLRYDQLQSRLQAEVGRYYKNFNLSVDLGQLRSIQIYVVGEAQQPGSYSLGSFSTLINALFACGGPSDQGSLRHVRLMRGGKQVTEMDLYDFIARGDGSKDARLEDGDVLVIPAIGAQVALAGSVRRPALYELRDTTTLADLLTLAGGLLPVAANQHIALERLERDQTRHATNIPLDSTGRSTPLQDGDILFVEHITTAFEKTVTIRGNLANPGRFSWRPGLRLNDILPDRMALLTTDYWSARNELGVSAPLFQPTGNNASPENVVRMNPSSLTEQADARTRVRNKAVQNTRLATGGVTTSQAQETGDQDQDAIMDPKLHRVQVPVPEISWSYAVIERLDPQTLRTNLLPFNLGKLVMNHDASQNLPLEPGDVVTIFSQADVPVSIDQQTKFVRLEGEVVSAGVYSVGAGETLVDIVRRAGGLTPKAYLYGSSFFRESARIMQQERLNTYLDELSLEMTRSAAALAGSAVAVAVTAQAPGVAQERAVIDELRRQRATGRVVLEFQPEDTAIAAIPALPMENGDVFRIPPRPSTISVIGAVYGQNVLLYNPQRKLADYLALAGKANRTADPKHAFIIRADGSIFSRALAQTTLSNTFDATHVSPGDTIVVPEKLIKQDARRTLLDYSQLLSSFGLAAAAINVVR